MSQYYLKGIGDYEIGESLRSAVAEGDCNEIATLVKLTGCERLPVDTFIKATPRVMRPPKKIMSVPHDVNPQYGSEEFAAELQQVHDLVELRDVPLIELPKQLPKGLRQVSKYLADEIVPKYPEGEDYGTDEASWLAIQQGKNVGMIPANDTTLIKTGRDAAAYVHNDNPMSPWVKFLQDLLSQDVEKTLPDSMTPLNFQGQSNFTVFGFPFFLGILGRALEVGGYTSFTTKWTEWKPRPEESSVSLGKGFLHLVYPEGSPMHPSFYAMHSFAALSQMYALLKFFNPKAFMASGETVEDEAQLLADNIGLWRLWPAVHFDILPSVNEGDSY